MDVDLQLFKNIMAEGRNNPDLLDSYSPNQFKSKERLVKLIRDQLIVSTDSEIVILGSWFGSILIPALKEVKRITLIDKDDTVIKVAKNRLFNHYNNVDFITADVFNLGKHTSRVQNARLIINASCENMKSMKELKPLRESKSFFAFQSNNMLEIHDSVNCVKSIDEFKKQLPDNAKVIVEDIIADDRGARFTLLGQL